MKKLALFAALLLIAPSTFAQAPQAQQVPQTRQLITLSYAPLVKQVAPAVVNIYAEKKVETHVASPLMDDPFFRRFFEGALPPGFTRERMENSLGSGVVISAKGMVVTSNHVISGADQIRVVLSDRREFDAKIVISDDHSDLAVLSIDTKGENLPFLELKDSDEAQIGDLVLAIGNPFGVGQTVTSGIISAMSRTSIGSGDLDYFIQTDAAINPGNSGGALVTMDGKLVGINSAIYSRDGGNLGIGFAVPSNMVRVVLNGVAQGEKSITHPWTGIAGQQVTATLAASLNMPVPSGMLVNLISSVSPALKAGMRTGDVVVSVNGKPVEDPESFRYRIATLPVGTTADIGIVRQGKQMSIQFPLIAPPEDPPRQETKITGQNPLAGADIANISPAVNEQIGMHGTEHGVVIINPGAGTTAASLGLATGDVILAVNSAKIANVGDVLAALKEPARAWKLSIHRGDSTMTVVVGGQ